MENSGNTEEKSLVIPSLSDQDLKNLARDIYEGRVYTDRHDDGEGFKAFYSVMLGGLSGYGGLENVGMVYEYVDKAGPMSVNGRPRFFSHRFLNTEDVVKISKYYEEYAGIIAQFSEKDPVMCRDCAKEEAIEGVGLCVECFGGPLGM